VRHAGLPWKVIACGLVLLNILLFSEVSTAQLTVNPSTLSFGSVPVGSNVTHSLVLGNSGGSNLTVSQAAMAGSGFSLSGPALPLTLAIGQSASFSVTFAPTSSGSVSGSLSLVSSTPILHGTNGKHNGSNSTTATVPLSGSGSSLSTASTTPGQLVANPSSLSFGNVQVSSANTLFDAVTNTGGSSVTLSQATVVGIGFSISGLSLPLTLAAGQSVTFSATFAPQSGVSTSGSISIASDASNSTMTISLAGTGMAQGQLAVTPTSTDFGSVTVGTSKTQAGTLSASGSSVSVSSATVTSAEFSVSGITFPLTIAAGQSIPFALTFTPQMSGSASAISSFTSNALNSAAETLAGTGAAPPQHSVDLSWNETSTVVGYNVYRGAQSGGPYVKINSALDASTTYTDSSVQAGQIYYYVTTAVDSSGAESSYSNQIQASVPSP
jgi:Abnormal spindle-like microcephaly-assoc'd, ASPM-SPD-2-Hydin